MIKKRYIIIALTIFIQSCVTILDIKLPLQDSIVLNGLILPGDTISILLNRSGIDTDSSFTYIDNAKVILFINEEEAERFQYIGGGKYQSLTVAKELTNYKIEVITVEGEKAWAETSTPEQNFGATINSPDENTLMNYGGLYNLTITDNPNYNNFYWICVERTILSYDSITTKTLAYSLYTNSYNIDKFNVTYDPNGNDTSNFDYGYFMHCDDKEFSGESITIDFHCGGNYGVKEEKVLVYNTDNNYSNYLKSKIINEEGADYISENGPPISYKPAFLYSNVHGGMGILGSYTTYTKTYTFN